MKLKPVKYQLIAAVFFGIFMMACRSSQNGNVIIENDHFRYEIGSDGTNLHFTDRASGTDYLDNGKVSKCACVISNDEKYDITSIKYSGKHLIMEFGSSGVIADIKVQKSKDRIRLTVSSVKGDAESLTFLDAPLNLEAMPYEPFAACVLSMNLFTHVRHLPALQNHLWAACYKRFGFEGAEITLLGVPQKDILPVIRDVISHAKDVPFSDKGGAWALMQKEGYGSYLMNFGTLTEETVGEWIEMCRNLGFNQIDNHGGGNFFRFGDFELNKQKWPDGWASFKRINDRLHEAGISSIFHTYAFFIDKNSKYVTPVPSHDLGYFEVFTLKEQIDSTITEITVEESTADVSTITGFHVENSVSLRIGDEIIEFSGVTTTPPYKFTACKRGANGTKATAHSANEKAFHLSERFGRFVPDPNTGLFNEIAGKTAEIVNECGFDGIYLDAIDGSNVLGGEENFWYYGTKFIFRIAEKLERPVGMEMSSMSHHWWHYRSRWQAWDRATRGYKRFFDIHLASIKTPALFLPEKMRSNEWEHGIWRGHSPLIDKYAAAENGGFLLPLHLGWYGNSTWNPPQGEPTFTDDVEYLCCKMAGNNAGLAMLGGVDKKSLEANPAYERLISIIRQYEELRHKNYFNDTIRAMLRQPGKEFTLFKEENGEWNLKPAKYDKHKVADIRHPSSQWSVNNEYREQAVKLRIELLMSVKPYNDPGSVVIADFSDSCEFINKNAADGVSGGIRIPSGSRKNEPNGIFYAQSAGLSPQEGSWIKMEKKFDPWLNLSKNQALGVWINGDGNGELLNFRLESPNQLSHGARGDHFIKIDFTGWKYFELVEIESSDFSNYIWPDESQFYVYNSYMHSIRFGSIDKLQLWYNNIPKDRVVSCQIRPVRALTMIPVTIENPSITIGNEIIVFPVRMESGMYLEFKSVSDSKLYGPKGEFIKDVPVKGNIPMIKNGRNKISFDCKGNYNLSSRVQVTVIMEGDPL